MAIKNNKSEKEQLKKNKPAFGNKNKQPEEMKVNFSNNNEFNSVNGDKKSANLPITTPQIKKTAGGGVGGKDKLLKDAQENIESITQVLELLQEADENGKIDLYLISKISMFFSKFDIFLIFLLFYK